MVNTDGTEEIVESNKVIEGDLTTYLSCMSCQGRVKSTSGTTGECI